ncbi:MAG: flagellar basal body P-ring formation chaperone FlgA [bacterium]
MRFLLTILVLFSATSAWAKAPDHVVEELQAVVEASLPAGAEVELTDVAVRGKLPAVYNLELRCDPLRVTNMRALIRSDRGTQLGWVTAKAVVRIPAVVVANAIPRGSNVASGTTVQLMEAREVPRNAVRPEDLADGVASRDLTPGKVISTSDVVLPKLIERGAPVELRVRRGTVVVSVRGIAMSSGRRGDLVRIKTSTAEGRTIEGVVVGPSVCEVP